MNHKLTELSTVEIDFTALQNNLGLLKGYLNKDTGMLAVVKADAYGHGAVEISRFLERDNSVKGFAVNSVGEGIALRNAGIEKQVLVFGVPLREEAGAYREYDLTATVSALSHFERLDDGTKYHINVDTGMRRLGIPPEALDEALGRVNQFEALTCTGVYSHLATADLPSTEYAAKQVRRFTDITLQFPADLDFHLANTGGLVFYPDSQFDLVRIGIGLYGYPPGQKKVPGLKPVLSWKSNIVQMRPVHRGDRVSYGGRWEAPGDGWIGTVPVGYFDGISRGLSGKLSVKVHGRIRPVVGTITMNLILVYLEGSSTDVDEGTEVVLLDQDLGADWWARKLETIPYEILTGIHTGIKRRYITPNGG